MNILELIKKHTEDGKFNEEAFEKEFKEEQAKAFVPKADFNAKNEELKSATTTLEQLKKDNEDVEALQTAVKEHETKVSELQEELAKERKTFAVKEALQGAGAKDVDYMMFKLGDVEVGDDGSIKDLDNKVKSLREENPNFFETSDGDDTDADDGFKVHDNALDTGGTKGLTKEKIMGIEDTEERQKAIKDNMKLFR